ncbi:mucin-3B-like isoform X4 [Canis lupus dingo]|uniref:mucin-3B-like isoform X4 n=1 Tax=Canis lupus dingo TaxID=286419 RepID=UPI0020C40E72|nr:mucin-3B-like isoform X4 [Canis lupus dingo]
MRISTSRWWRRTGSVASPNALRAWTAPLTVTRTDALCRGGSRLRLLLHGHALVLGAALRGGRRPASAGGGPGGVAAVLLLLLLLLVSLSVFVARSRRGGQGEGGSWEDDRKWFEVWDEDTVGTFSNLDSENNRTGAHPET